MYVRHLTVITFSIWACSAGAACVASGPLETARWIHSNARGFAFQAAGEDLSKRARFLSPALYGLLQADWNCQNVEEGICNLDADPWINAQDGEELAPITFALAAQNASSASVAMSFLFGWQGSNEPKPVAAQAKLAMVLDQKTGCWLLDDLIGRDKLSLKKQLQP